MERTRHHPGTRILTVHQSGQGLTSVLQSLGWEHYEVHEPEPHILLFKYAANVACTTATADVLQAAHQLSTTCHGSLVFPRELMALKSSPITSTRLLFLANGRMHP